MPTKIEKDRLTGKETTGHEWDGIKELNTPLPKWWLYVFYACIIWSIGYMVLYPAIPLGTSYTKGLLGWSSRDQVRDQIADARERQGEFLVGVQEASLEEILADDTLFTFAQRGGAIAFADNCSACHGAGGKGNEGGFPVLADDAWIWGGSLEAIHHTIAHGVRWEDDPDTRFNMMPAYGDGLLSEEEIAQVTDYVLSLSGRAPEGADLALGEEVFAIQCAACHGEMGEGVTDLGGPNLSDAIWLYGGERNEVMAQIVNPQHGVMPSFQVRLEDETLKMLAIYVHSLGGGQ
ncbi:MAG: cytochrome-c oxidase, cbb3-type subunit III [Kiloniellales bacterium]